MGNYWQCAAPIFETAQAHAECSEPRAYVAGLIGMNERFWPIEADYDRLLSTRGGSYSNRSARKFRRPLPMP